MRKILLVVTLALATIVNAQCYTKFKGIEIKGNIDAFSAQLEKQGFKLEKREPVTYLYSGKFGGEDVGLLVNFSVKTHTVASVSVVFDDKDTRELIERRYHSLQELLTQKYGEPYEKDVPYSMSGKNDYTEGTCTRWKDNCGGITLKDTYVPVSKYSSVRMVMVMYWSEEGYSLSESEYSEDL